jgi:hypothetical protein
LLDPPSTIRTQLATLCRVKTFDGLHQTDVFFRNQIQEREPEIRVVMSDLNDQSEVCFDIVDQRSRNGSKAGKSSIKSRYNVWLNGKYSVIPG